MDWKPLSHSKNALQLRLSVRGISVLKLGRMRRGELADTVPWHKDSMSRDCRSAAVRMELS